MNARAVEERQKEGGREGEKEETVRQAGGWVGVEGWQ